MESFMGCREEGIYSLGSLPFFFPISQDSFHGQLILRLLDHVLSGFFGGCSVRQLPPCGGEAGVFLLTLEVEEEPESLGLWLGGTGIAKAEDSAFRGK